MSRSNLAAHPSALLEHCQEASTTDGYTVCPQKKLRNSVDKIHGETIVRQLTKLVASSFGLRSIQATVCYQNSQKYLKFPRNHSNNVHRCKFKQLIPFRGRRAFFACGCAILQLLVPLRNISFSNDPTVQSSDYDTSCVAKTSLPFHADAKP